MPHSLTPPESAPSQPPPQRQTIANERTKLLANAIDRASTACFVLGLLSPLATRTPLDMPAFFVCLAFSIGLHLFARKVLGGLK